MVFVWFVKNFHFIRSQQIFMKYTVDDHSLNFEVQYMTFLVPGLFILMYNENDVLTGKI